MQCSRIRFIAASVIAIAALAASPLGAQDQLMQLSQGPVAPREHEHLRSSDRGVIAVRKVLREAIKDVQDDRDPRGVLRGKAGEEVMVIDVADHLAPADTTLAPA